MLFGKEATLASLRSVRGDLLHLAAEIRFSSRRPVTGTVLLGDGLALDGTTQVSLGAIFSIPAASAVIVSNISGRLPTADRTLAAAFLANGSSAVVLHAAPLTRKAKKVFGESFYTALQSGSSVPAAVRAAQGIMVRSRELSAPHYWAPLMVWGEGD
jgi:CHAT domain-containing protein